MQNPYSHPNGYFRDSPEYNNTQFITAFSNSFMAMAMDEAPDNRYTPGDITPSWDPWLNNKTPAGAPDVHTFMTYMAVLKRCA